MSAYKLEMGPISQSVGERRNFHVEISGPEDLPTRSATIHTTVIENRGAIEPPQSRPTRHHQVARCELWSAALLWPNLWRSELLAISTSFASFIGLAAVAWAYSGQPMSAWPTRVISINGFVSALTTVLKMSLLFSISEAIGQAKWSWFSPRARNPGRPLNDLQVLDAASRGVSGSLRWLFRHATRRHHFINVGAALTILAAPLDVFSQQLISIQERQVEDPQSRAYLPWAANNFALDDRSWSAAMLHGLYSLEVQDLPVECPGDHCVWDAVPSVGVCGKCKDIKDELPIDWMSCSGPLCNYTLPQQEHSQLPPAPQVINAPKPMSTWFDISAHVWETAGKVPAGQSVDYHVPLSVLIPYSAWLPVFEEEPTLTGRASVGYTGALSLGYFYVIHTPVSEPGNHLTVYHEPTVTRCGFWHCMQSFQAKFLNGTLHQTISISRNQTWVQGSVYKAGAFNDIAGFNMQGRAFEAMRHSTRMKRDVLFSQDSDEIFMCLDSKGVKIGQIKQGKPFFLMWDIVANDLDAWVERASRSMSNAIRSHYRPSGANATAYDGKVFRNTVYIHVSWPWIAYPLVLMVVGATFFAISIGTALREEHDLWGNDALALALSDVDPELRNDSQGPHSSLKGLERRLGASRVTFQRTGTGWSFKKV